jgi:hypothetical protein
VENEARAIMFVTTSEMTNICRSASGLPLFNTLKDPWQDSGGEVDPNRPYLYALRGVRRQLICSSLNL